MPLRNLDDRSDPRDWDRKWIDIFSRYQGDLRHAHYVRAFLRPHERRILEIAAGSFRDMAALCRMGRDCSGMDFSAESVSRARETFPEFAQRIFQMSAFAMTFEDRSFDVSYHNGFWILFEDEQILKLSAEQARVTRSRMIATVHNAHNRQFVEYFESKKQDDPLYDIRFFSLDEIATLMEQVCTDIRVVPVGKSRGRHEDWLIRRGLTSPSILRTYLNLSGHRMLEQSERLLCFGTPR